MAFLAQETALAAMADLTAAVSDELVTILNDDNKPTEMGDIVAMPDGNRKPTESINIVTMPYNSRKPTKSSDIVTMPYGSRKPTASNDIVTMPDGNRKPTKSNDIVTVPDSNKKPTESNDIVTITDNDDGPTEGYEDDDGNLVAVTTSPLMALSRRPRVTTTSGNTRKPEIVEKTTEKISEKSQTTNMSPESETLASSKPPLLSTFAGVASPTEELELTTALRAPSSSGVAVESTGNPYSRKMTDAIIGQSNTESVTTDYTTLLQNLPVTISETSTVPESLPATMPTSGVTTSSSYTSSLSTSSLSSTAPRFSVEVGMGKTTQKTPEKSQTMNMSAETETLASSKPPLLSTFAGIASPTEESELTTALGAPSVSKSLPPTIVMPTSGVTSYTSSPSSRWSVGVRQTREATTPSEPEEQNCASYTFEPDRYPDFIQTKDSTTHEMSTRFEIVGWGIFGGDYWNKSSPVDVDDSYVRVDLNKELIVGESYEITRRWCNNDSCPESGRCPSINITRGLQGRDINSVQLEEASTTSVSVLWSLRYKAYIPELNIILNLTNEKGPPVERTVATIRESDYTTSGSFILDKLASGARYRLRFASSRNEEEWNKSEIEFITVPAMPENLTIQQLNYSTASVRWHQPYYSDNFTVSYDSENSTLVESQTHDTFLVLENLTPEAVYNVSVIAQTQNLSSVPNSMILRLEPPNLVLEVLQENTTSVSMKMTTKENIEKISISFDNNHFLNFTNVHGEREFSVAPLTPGEAYQLKFQLRIREFMWKQQMTIATRPLPPVILSVDNTNFSRLEVCWRPQPSGGYDSFHVQFRSSQRAAAPLSLINETFCYSQKVIHGDLYTVSVSTRSHDLESDPAEVTALARPAPPVVTEISKTSRSVNITISCPKENFNHLNVLFCGRKDDNCTWEERYCDSGKLVIGKDGLTPGNRYTFQAVSVRVSDDLRAESDIVTRQITTYPLPPTNLSVHKISGLEIIIQWRSRCAMCNYSITAVPHNRHYQNASFHSTCTYVIEFDEYRVCRYSLDFQRELPHDITVKSVSWGEKSLTGATVRNVTMPKAIKYVTNIRLEPVLPSVLSVNFDPPEVPEEQITRYEIKYGGTRKTGEVICPNGEKTYYPEKPLPINVTVRGGCLYEFSIKAFFGSKAGEEAVARVETIIGAPVAKNIQPKYPDRSTITHHGFEVIFDSEMFSDENGPLENFAVIVAEASEGTHNALYQPNGTLPGWSESIRENPIPPYQISPKVEVTYSNDERISKRSIVSQAVKVGDQSCGSSDEKYCNGPLVAGRTYIYWFRGFTSAGYADTEPSQHISLPKSQFDLIIACLIILMILFLIVIILIGLLLRKRLRMDSKGDYQPAPTDPVLLKSMSKNSSRAKYIRAVKLTEFCQDFHVMSAHSNFGYSQEFENLRRVGKKLTSYDAVLPENVSKNRYTNILPYDKTRVKLGSIDDELGSDYINANWIPGFSSPREYIACQGPLPGTVDDMWRMVWEKNVNMIVMVTQLVEKGKVKCDQYWPEDHKPVFYGDIQVTMTQKTETESWNMKEFNLYKPYVDQKKKVKHFNYLSWPDHGVPENSESLLNFIEVVRQQSPKNGSPMIVHCSAGCGRTGTFICLDRLLQQIEEFDYVNILGTVAEMRSHRQHMVQTEQQYVFIHRCVLDILEDKGIAPKPSSIPMNGNTGGMLLLEAIV